jgi:hypothetical protein
MLVHQDLVPTTNIVIVSASAVRPILASARLRFRFDWRHIQRPAPRRPSENALKPRLAAEL